MLMTLRTQPWLSTTPLFAAGCINARAARVVSRTPEEKRSGMARFQAQGEGNGEPRSYRDFLRPIQRGAELVVFVLLLVFALGWLFDASAAPLIIAEALVFGAFLLFAYRWIRKYRAWRNEGKARVASVLLRP